MTRQLQRLATAAILCAALVGCGIDTSVIIEHPAKVKPSATMSVVFADMLAILSNADTLSYLSVTKDSLHVAAGLPAGWSISALSYYVAGNLKLTTMLGTTIDTQALVTLVNDSLQTYSSRSLPMASDIGNKKFFSGKQIKATDQAGDSLMVNTDSVPQWLVYSSRINLTFPVGTRMDTTIPFPDSLMKSLGVTLPPQVTLDSLGIKLVPILVFATVNVGASNGDFNLFYFTKTGKIPAAVSDTSGSMVYATVNVSPTNAVRNPRLAATWESQFDIFPNPLRANDAVTITSLKPIDINIYTGQGQLVRSLSSNGARAMVWNGTSADGARLSPGTYFVRSKDGTSIPKSINLLK